MVVCKDTRSQGTSFSGKFQTDHEVLFSAPTMYVVVKSLFSTQATPVRQFFIWQNIYCSQCKISIPDRFLHSNSFSMAH